MCGQAAFARVLRPPHLHIFPFRDRYFNSIQFSPPLRRRGNARDGSGNMDFVGPNLCASVRTAYRGAGARSDGREDGSDGWALKRKIPRGGNKARAGSVRPSTCDCDRVREGGRAMKSRLFSLKSRKREATRLARKPYFKTLRATLHVASSVFPSLGLLAFMGGCFMS